MTVQSFTFNPFQTNGFICHDGGEAVLVDAPGRTPAEHQAVHDYLARHDLTVRHLLLTHAHIDHIFGCHYWSEQLGMPWQVHREDLPFITRSQEQAQFFGFALEAPPLPETYLQDGDTVIFGGATWDVLHTPGHSPGSVSFHDAANGFVIAGDVLFHGSIGRTDLPGGSMPVLMQSIFQRLLPLGDGTAVYCGHGPATTVGRERQHNPFLTDEGGW